MPSITKTITAAQVAALNATPVEIIPAPGSGRTIIVEDCEWFLDFGTAAYDAAAAGDTLGMKYTNGSGDQVLQTLAGNTIGAAAADYHAFVRAADNVIPVENAAIVAHIDNGEWYAAAGDSPLKCKVSYRVIELLSGS